MTPLEKAILLAGSGSKLARLLDVTSMTVTQWKRRGVPAERCMAIERAVNGAVTRYDLRPDVFGDGTQPAAPAKAA